MNGLSVFLVAFVTSVLVATGTVFVIQRYDLLEPKSEETLVPDLRGLSEKDARANLEAARLSLLVGAREPSAKVKAGSVIRQSVPAGQNLPVRHPVTVILADDARVPNLSGSSIDDATRILAERGMKIEIGPPIAHETVPVGKIAAQAPQADSAHDPAIPVVVQLSTGTAAVPMPKVVGQSVDRAKAELEKLGLKLAPVRWVSIAETATFIVLSQKPPAGEQVKVGSEVELSANR